MEHMSRLARSSRFLQVADQRIAKSPIWAQTAPMLRALSPAAILLAVLALAGPASAQAPDTSTTPAPVCSGVGESDPGTCSSAGDQTIGPGQVVTDPADQVDGPTVPDDGDAPAADSEPKQGEQHVLGTTASSPAPVAAPPAPATRPVATTGQKTLPFTGVNAGPLVLTGLLLLGSGMLLRRRLEA
jgi:hypothetical protein